MSHLRRLAPIAALCVALFAPPPALRAQAGAEYGFQGYLQVLAARARSEGVSEATISQMTWGLTFNPQVVEFDRAQPGVSPNPPPFAPYLSTHVDAARISEGRRMYSEVAGLARKGFRRTPGGG